MGEFKEYHHHDVAASHSRPPTVSLMSNGAIYVSPTAMDALEWLDYVRLRFDDDEDIVEITPATEDTLHPLPCVTDGIRGAHKQTGRGRTIYARFFFDAINRKPRRAQAIPPIAPRAALSNSHFQYATNHDRSPRPADDAARLA